MAAIWLILGICLMLAELLLPGGVAVLVGFSAFLVGLLILAGLIQGWGAALFTWIVLTILLVLALHKTIKRWLRSESSYDFRREDAESYAREVEVVAAITAGGTGRINYQGSTWTARNHHPEHHIAAGERARLLYREGLVWVVEPLDHHESGNASTHDSSGDRA